MRERADPMSGVASTDEHLLVEVVVLQVDLEIGISDPILRVSEIEKDLVL